jgi:hypothetical protein
MPVLVGATALDVSVTRRWSIGFGAFGELDVLGHHFDLSQSGELTPLASPWRVKPAAAIFMAYAPD